MHWLIGGIFLCLLVFCVTSSPIARQRGSVLVFLLLGVVWSAWFAGERKAQMLPEHLEGQPLQVTGYLCDVPSAGNFDSVRFSLCVTGWPALEGEVLSGLPERLKLAWYGPQARLEVPHQLLLTVVLKRPHGSLNPSGFRYETWLFRQGYGATGTVRELSSSPEEECSVRCGYHRWRNQWAAALHQRLSATEHFAIAEALIIGNRGWVTPAQWQVFQQTGTIHLVAISGLHLGLIATGVAFLARWILGFLPLSLVSPARQRWCLTASVLIVCLGYALLAGFTVPTRRALIMVAVACWVLVWPRQSRPWAGWQVALFLVLLVDPYAPLDQGFWLSFGAVAVLILVFSGWVGRCHWSLALILAQAAVFVGLWPVLVAIGQPQVTMGAPANLVAVPWVSLVVMPVVLLGGAVIALVPDSAHVVGQGYDLVLGVLWQFLSWLAVWSDPLPAAGVWVPFLLGVLVLVSLVIPVRFARGLAFALCGVWLATGVLGGGEKKVANPDVDAPEVWVWDVGQGLSVLVRHQRGVLIYDTGPSYPGGYSAVESVLLPNLSRLGVGQIDWLVVSHGDADHAGGLATLLSRFLVAEFASGEPERVRQRIGDGYSGQISSCSGLDGIRVGEIEVTAWQHANVAPSGGNDRSCVLTLRYGGVEWVLPGDISADTERAFLDEVPPRSASYRAVVAAHHGSKTSSDTAWVNALKPDLVIFSAGYRHRFGHPHPTVIDRYREAGSALLNTAETGAIHLRFETEGEAIDVARDRQPFWIAPPPLSAAYH
ncbi:DNA internalization-related competence protein ComEC/Rec2 [Marinobacter zhejiangensis]|uniref:DNA internalization-related competence protein ComEC/Rec2 n=1 Tax=Marinobacter zhejiangensis TaxID=488535 RepID=UPI002481D4C0|nr:DNA internalization-related competence protein ComEC/Rec2 [Marinobacter zhejiangensis]